jgi:hypothetical protein
VRHARRSATTKRTMPSQSIWPARALDRSLKAPTCSTTC